MGLDAARIRKDFPILGRKIDRKLLVYLDNAATSQKPRQVIEAVDYYYRNYNANVHRGIYRIAEEATAQYVRSKELVAKFINAGSYRSVVYCRNCTEAINIVARSWAEENVGKGDRILLTEMEHHSNIVPWQMLAKRKGAVIDYVPLKGKKEIDMDAYAEKLEREPKLVSFTHVSNVLGTINDARRMIRMAHARGATTVLDAAQSAPHMALDAKALDCDFMAFSGHKMLAPAGIGVLYGKDELLEGMEPVFGGGDMIRSVDFRHSEWNELPWKFEAGTQNIEGAIGLGAAVEYLDRVGMDRIREHEKELTAYAMEKLAEHGVYTYGLGRNETARRAGVIPFRIDGAHAHDVAQIFDSEGIAIRSGHHCAMPLVTKVLGVQAVARMSFYLYNTKTEIDRAAEAVEKVRKVLRIGK